MMLGDRIHNARIDIGLSEIEVAKVLKMSKVNYKKIEDCVDFPSLPKLRELSNLLNKSIFYLLFGRENSASSLSCFKLTESDYLYQWNYYLLSVKETDVVDKQFATLNSYSKHLLKELGEIRLNKASVFDFNNLFEKMYNEGYSKKTIKEVRNIAKEIYQLAIDMRIYDYNPLFSTKIPKKAPDTKKTEPIEETTQKIIMEFQHPMQLPAMIMLFAGLRRGELLALRFSDIKLEKQYIKVTKAVEYIKGVPHLKATKTDAGTRYVDIPDLLCDFIHNYLKHNPEIKNDNLIFPNSKGNLCDETRWKKMWKDYYTKMNDNYGYVEYFTSKQLRHTYCSLLYFAGVEALETKELMGHSDIKVTLGTYTHLDKIQKRKSLKKVNDYLKTKYKIRKQK